MSRCNDSIKASNDNIGADIAIYKISNLPTKKKSPFGMNFPNLRV